MAVICAAAWHLLPLTLRAVEYHVAVTGRDVDPGTPAAPLRTIQRAADLAQPGDTVTVHAGVYRERVDPPRGGASDAKRIVYRAAPGEKVVITGSEPMRGWEKVRNDTWKATVPNTVFGPFNPYGDVIRGDWCSNPHGYHTGAVYLNGDWLEEAARLENLSTCPPAYERKEGCLLNVAWLRPPQGVKTPAVRYAAQQGVKNAPCSEGGECIGWIENGDWVRYDDIGFGSGAESLEIRAASVTGGGVIEIRDGSPVGELLGTCAVADTGDHRFYNNLFVAPCKLAELDKSALPCLAAGNVYTKGSQPLACDAGAFVQPEFEPDVRLNERPDGWYLVLSEDTRWRGAAKSQPVTTSLLGAAKVSGRAYENADGSPVTINADCFGKPRDKVSPMPGPFETVGDGKTSVKVWCAD